MSSKQQKREEAVSVSDDAQKEAPVSGTAWLAEGEWVTIFTADPAFHGRLVAITPSHYFLADASWVPDTGRRHEYSKDPSKANEVEFIGDLALERPVVSVERVLKAGALKTK